jgi:hypothetical protein
LTAEQRQTCIRFLDKVWEREADVYEGYMEKPLIHVNVKFLDHAAAELLLGKNTKSETVF